MKSKLEEEFQRNAYLTRLNKAIQRSVDFLADLLQPDDPSEVRNVGLMMVAFDYTTKTPQIRIAVSDQIINAEEFAELVKGFVEKTFEARKAQAKN